MPSVTRRTQGNRAARRAEMRDRLLAVVERLLAEGETFTELSVERLVQEACISRSTFYVYFEDKGDLLRAWFGQIVDELETAAGAWWALDGEASREDVRAALEVILRAYRPHVMLMAAVYDAAGYDATVREEVQAMMGRSIAGLRQHIRRGQRAGWVSAELAPGETAAWLTWMAERGQHQMVRGADDAEFDALVDAYAGVVWHALYAHAPSRG